MKLPQSINIVGIEHKVFYFDKPSDVDAERRKSLWGQYDAWTRTIRIYRNDDTPLEDVLQFIIHEILHAINSLLHLNEFDKEDNHDDLDVLALALSDLMIRNNWMYIEDDISTKKS